MPETQKDNNWVGKEDTKGVPERDVAQRYGRKADLCYRYMFLLGRGNWKAPGKSRILTNIKGPK